MVVGNRGFPLLLNYLLRLKSQATGKEEIITPEWLAISWTKTMEVFCMCTGILLRSKVAWSTDRKCFYKLKTFLNPDVYMTWKTILSWNCTPVVLYQNSYNQFQSLPFGKLSFISEGQQQQILSLVLILSMPSWKLKRICLNLNLVAWDQEDELGLGRGTARNTDNDSDINIR